MSTRKTSFFGKIFQWIGDLFTKIKHVAEELAPKAIELVNIIKDFDTANPEFADILTAIIPGTWDDALKDKARAALPQILAQMNIVKDDISTLTVDEFLVKAIDELNKLMPAVRGLNLHNISVLLTSAFADGKISVPEITGIMQAVYELIDENKKKEEATNTL